MSWQQNAVQRVQDKSASDPPDDTSTDSSILRYIKTLSKHQTNAKQQRMDQYLQQVKHAENFSTRVFNPPRHMTTTEGQGQQVQKKLSASTVKSKGNDRVRNDRKQATRFTKTSRSRSKRPHETNLENRQLKKPKRAQQTTAIEWLEQFRLHGTWSQKSATRPNEDYSSDKTHQDTTVPAGSKHVQPIERLQSPTVPQTASRINADTERRPIQELKPLSKKTRTAPVEGPCSSLHQSTRFSSPEEGQRENLGYALPQQRDFFPPYDPLTSIMESLYF